MKIQLETGGGQNFIRSYDNGRVTINEQVYRTSLIVTPDRIIPDWPPRLWDELNAEHIQRITLLNPEIVILGTGARLHFPSPAITHCLGQAHIGLEVMDTGAACRTYNVLMGEGRRVAAALLMIEE